MFRPYFASPWRISLRGLVFQSSIFIPDSIQFECEGVFACQLCGYHAWDTVMTISIDFQASLPRINLLSNVMYLDIETVE